MITVCITGGTGMIGTVLTKYLAEKGCRIIILSRHPKPASGNISYATWDLYKQTIDATAIQQADYIVHTAGAGVADKRWTKKRKQEIMDSRVKSGELLVKALTEIPNKVKAVISMAGISWYGDDAQRTSGKPYFTESDPHINDFLAEVCVQWEAAIKPVTQLGKRLAILRTGPVLSNEGGAFAEFKKPVRFGIAAFLGNGRQIISWIHIDDMVRLIFFAMENDNMQGVYNAVSPQPVSNKSLMLLLAKKMKGSFFIPGYVPAFMLKIMVGGVSVEVLRSATISSNKVTDAGFQFLYPSIDTALNNLVGK